MMDKGIRAIHHDCEPQVTNSIFTDWQPAASAGKSNSRPEFDSKHACHRGSNREEMLKKVAGISIFPNNILGIMLGCESLHKIDPIIRLHAPLPIAN